MIVNTIANASDRTPGAYQRCGEDLVERFMADHPSPAREQQNKATEVLAAA